MATSKIVPASDQRLHNSDAAGAASAWPSTLVGTELLDYAVEHDLAQCCALANRFDLQLDAPMSQTSFAARMANLTRRALWRWLLRGALHGATTFGLVAALGLSAPLAIDSLTRAFGASPPGWATLPVFPNPSWPSLLGGNALALVTASLAGAAWAWYRRPARADLALLFDHKLGSHQEISAAFERLGSSDPWSQALFGRAATLLESGPARRLLPRTWLRAHWLLPAGLLLFNGALLTRPAAPVSEADPGTQLLTLGRLDELTLLGELAETTSSKDALGQRLRDLGARASELGRQLSAGMSQREALAEVARLQDSVQHELDQLTARHERTALDAAISVFQNNPDTLGAAQALGDGDLERLDEEMRRLSAAEERAARLAAHQSLRQAEAAALAAGGVGLARNLSEQREVFEQRALASERQRSLIAELGPRRDGPPGFDGAATEQAPERRNAPLGTTPAPSLDAAEEPDQSRGQSRGGVERGQADFRLQPGSPAYPAQGRPAGEARQDVSQALPKPGEPSPSSRRYQTLMNASRALARLQSTLSGDPLPLPQPRSDPQGLATSRHGSHGQASGGHNPNPGDHTGKSGQVSGLELHAKTDQPFDPRRGRSTMSMGRSAAQAVPNTGLPPGALRAAAPEQLEGVSRASIPAEYRQQVSRYFSSE